MTQADNSQRTVVVLSREPAAQTVTDDFNGAFGRRRGVSEHEQLLREIGGLPAADLLAHLHDSDTEARRRTAALLRAHLSDENTPAFSPVGRQRLWMALAAERDSAVVEQLLSGLTDRIGREATGGDLLQVIGYLAVSADESVHAEQRVALARAAAPGIAALRGSGALDDRAFQELLGLYDGSDSPALAWVLVAAAAHDPQRPGQLADLLRADLPLLRHGELARAWAQLLGPVAGFGELLHELALTHPDPAPGSPMADLAAYWARVVRYGDMGNGAWELLAAQWAQLGTAYDPLKRQLGEQLAKGWWFPQHVVTCLADGDSLELAREVFRAAVGVAPEAPSLPVWLFGADIGTGQRQLPEYRDAVVAISLAAATDARKLASASVQSLTVATAGSGRGRRTAPTAFAPQLERFAHAVGGVGDWAAQRFCERALTGAIDIDELRRETTDRVADALADLLADGWLAGALLHRQAGARKLRRRLRHRERLLDCCRTQLHRQAAERQASSRLFPGELGAPLAQAVCDAMLDRHAPQATSAR